MKDVYYDDDGNLVFVFDDDTEITVKMPECEHEYEAFNMKVADCDDAGLIFHVCFKCNDSYYERIDPLGHDYEKTATNYVAGEDDDPENGVYNGEWTVSFECSVCGNVETVPAELVAETADPSHTEKGSITFTLNYEFDGEEYSDDMEALKVILERVGKHSYNENELDEDKEYTADELKEIFGEDYDALEFEYDSANDDGDLFTVTIECTECGDDVIILRRDAHSYGDAEVTLTGDEEHVNVVYTCEYCGNKVEFSNIGERKHDEPNCSQIEKIYVEYSYEFNGETVNGIKYIEVLSNNSKIHKFNGKYYNLDDVITESEAIAAGMTHRSGTATCEEKATYKFECELCNSNKNIKVIGDHSYEFVEEDERNFDAESYEEGDDIVFVYCCANCGDEQIVEAEIGEPETTEPTCIDDGYTVVSYSYIDLASGEEVIGEVTYNVAAKTVNIHRVAVGDEIVTLNTDKVYRLSEINEWLDVLEAQNEFISCTEAEEYDFVCIDCGYNHDYLKVLDDHTCDLLDEESIGFDYDVETVAEGDEIIVTYKYICSVCEDEEAYEEEELTAFVEIVEATAEEDGELFIEFEIDDKPYYFQLKVLPAVGE